VCFGGEQPAPYRLADPAAPSPPSPASGRGGERASAIAQGIRQQAIRNGKVMRQTAPRGTARLALPLAGRAIAYGNSRVASDACANSEGSDRANLRNRIENKPESKWEPAASGSCSTRSKKPANSALLSICNRPALAGEGRGGGTLTRHLHRRFLEALHGSTPRQIERPAHVARAPSPSLPRKRERECLRRTAREQNRDAAAWCGGAP
jgi:hypothetical protein